ncbi:hypothetical protein LOY34_13965 [Pseudomonas sp. B21-009]|uniref:hypothetical protein n=1 Tax=Pseudomonas sp. B21-009 TaxID=2895470 RepID=UPI00215F1A0F|nr:hypothetical protein [Pseudomonas sp. B21-009]UVM64458.1 hypothetical protein LOY34_13965 [Pseudomonas sp. B21-009]
MKRADIVALIAVVVGSFVTGVVWAPAFSGAPNIKDMLEATSYIATILACGVAATALSSWKKQFRYTERFSRISKLKDAATDLHLYRGYLQAIGRACDFMFDGEPVPAEAKDEITQRRDRLLEAFSNYRKAWTSAVAFLNKSEEARIKGTPDAFISLYLKYPDDIYEACRSGLNSGDNREYVSLMRTAISEAKDLYAHTVSSFDSLLADKI